MSSSIYRLTREIAIISSVILSCVLLGQDEMIRALMNMILLFLFIFSSKLFEKKYRAITISYIFVFVIVYFVDSLIAGIYNDRMIRKINEEGNHGEWLGDYYNIYFFSVLLFYLIIIIYLKTMKMVKYNHGIDQIRMSNSENKNFCVGSVLLTIMYFLMGRRYEVIVPVFIFLLARIFFFKEKRVIYLIWLLSLAYIMSDIWKSRFEFVGVMLPFLLMFIVLYQEKRKLSLARVNLVFVLMLFCIGIYGVVSEVYKLNVGHNSDYNLHDILINIKQLSSFFYRQFYRVFIIWIKLGGYIIYHVKHRGFYYGMSYIKSLSGVIGFEYISLPQICAVYNGAGTTYAQPGLLAEGYANFGIFGAVVNLLSVFFLMEYFSVRFYKQPSYSRLFYMVIPFSKILLDGGTLNSAIYWVIMCFVLDILNFMIAQKKTYNKMTYSLDEEKNTAGSRKSKISKDLKKI